MRRLDALCRPRRHGDRLPAYAYGSARDKGSYHLLEIGLTSPLEDPEEDLDEIAGKQQGEEGEEPREQGQEFYVISPTSGLLAPGDTAKVAITFAARVPGECPKSFNIEITDLAEPPVLGVVATKPIALQGRGVRHSRSGRVAREG